ncbi:MAG: polyribonucleotide nucleotidyltransferase, partial [Candidatus Subteraquimicrobiales bacterium]|nr:polyribonucleotide nucleotidyltransferase [Candidatus Subteraquimicrobiales bacterium]
MASIFSVDQVNPPDVLAIIGASAALTASDMPFLGPIGAVRISRHEGRWIINPTFQEIKQSDMDMVVTGNRNGILMVEAGLNEVPEEEIVVALEKAHENIVKLIDFQEDFRAKIGTIKKEPRLIEIPGEVEYKVREYATDKLRETLKNPDKLEREDALVLLEDETMERLTTMLEGKERFIAQTLEKIQKEEIRRMILEENKRVDGRKTNEIRPISCLIHPLPRPHGSAIFTRGQTQVLGVVTLGTISEEQRINGIGVEESKRFMYHYNFPPFSTGDVGILRGPRRREIGHGALAERALLSLIPDEVNFPYTIRLVAEVLESNGSSSMASVCAGSLALMDAGVPVREHVSSIAMGLVIENEKYAVLTDILGMEDALGDMDFKVAGTANGVTALQMDLKIAGISREILKEALEQAKKARLFILEKMNEAIDKPREKLSEFAPQIYTLKVDKEKIGGLIGPGGKTIRGIIEETGVSIDIQDDGTVYIASKDVINGERAKTIVENLTREPVVGEKYMGTVTKTTTFGAFVEIFPGKEGLIHISKLSRRRISAVEDVINVGDKILVEIIEIDKMKRINLAPVEDIE